jgi:hypothetical protein
LGRLRKRGSTSHTDALIVRLLVEKVDDLTSKESSSSANADLELARRTLGDSDVTIVFRKLDGKGFYNQQKTPGEVLSTPISAKEKAKRRPSKTTQELLKWTSSS